MGLDIKDLAGLGEPAKKLIELVGAGIGGVFRPREMRNAADAKAYEIRAIASAEADADEIRASGKVRAELARVVELAAGDGQIVERARLRLLSREVEGQLNIEAIAEKTLARLPDSVSDQPVADDWRRKFFTEAENICDGDLQLLWAKVLAGEVASPGSYSLRTLETLKHLSKWEAELFRIACSLAFSDGWMPKPSNDINTAFAPYGLDFNGLLALRDAGLIYEGDFLSRKFLLPTGVSSLVLINNGVLIQLSGASLTELQVPSIPFTRAGKELQNLIEPTPVMPFLKAVAASLRQKALAVKVGRVTETQPGQSVMTFDEDL